MARRSPSGAAVAWTTSRPRSSKQLFVGSLQVRDESARFLGGESLGEALDRVLPAFDELVAREWQTALAVFHGGVNRILLSHALAGGRTYFGTFEQAPACINVLDLGAPTGRGSCARSTTSRTTRCTRRARRRWSTSGRS